MNRTSTHIRPLSISGTRATSADRYVGDIVLDGGGVAGSAFGVGERPEFTGPIVADRVDADDLAVLGDLHRPGDDRHLDGLPGPAHPAAVIDAGEADGPARVDDAGHTQPGRRRPGPPLTTTSTGSPANVAPTG